MYSRWEHLGPTNDVKLFAANPDGTQMIAVGGQHGKPSNSLFSIKETSTPNVMTRHRHGSASGRSTPGRSSRSTRATTPTGLHERERRPDRSRLPRRGEHVLHGAHPQRSLDSSPSPVVATREPSLLPDGRILTSWAQGPVNDLAEQSGDAARFRDLHLRPGHAAERARLQRQEPLGSERPRESCRRATPPAIGALQGAQNASVRGANRVGQDHDHEPHRDPRTARSSARHR